MVMLSTLILSAQETGKKFDINVTDESMPSVLKQIGKSSGVKILFTYNDVRDYKVTVNLTGVTAEEAVEKVISGKPLTSIVRDGGKYISIMKRTVRTGGNTFQGKVVDQNGAPLPGVNVLSGNRGVAATDANGEFSVKGEEGKPMTLTFSYVGYESQTLACKYPVQGLSVVLEESQDMLEEVMVTGYQTLSKERTTGSFDKVGAEIIAARPASDLSSVLQGLVAGMQATEKEDGSVDFLIRGTSSLYANTAPLVVVDGFPIEGSFSNINPNDVESVTVLKDAAAASIWGARSANGVIVVTTKHGSKNGKLNVDAQAFWRFTNEPDIEYITGRADSKTSVDYEFLALENGWDMGSGYTPGLTNLGSALTQAQCLYFQNKYYGLSEADMNAGLNRLRGQDNLQQIKDNLMQQQLLQQYNVNISGGTEKFQTYSSLLYEKNDESTIKRGYERFMVNFNGTYKFNKRITGTVGAYWQQNNRDNSGVTISDLSSLNSYEMLLNEDGSYANQVRNWNWLELENIDQSKFEGSFDYNMLKEVRNRSYKTQKSNYRVQLGLNAKIWHGIEYDMKYQYESNRSDYRNLDGEDSYAANYLVNYMTNFNPNTGAVGSSSFPSGGMINAGKSVDHGNVFRNQISYNEVYNEKHDISALIGMEATEYVTNLTTDATKFGYKALTNTTVDPYYGSKDSFPCINGYALPYSYLSYYIDFTAGGNTKRTDRYLSFFGNAAYTYDGRYSASFSIRSDGSNYVTEKKSLRYSPMWSVGAKWNISKEQWFEAENVNYLTLRATYGLNGNSEKSTSTKNLLYLSNNTSLHALSGYVSSFGNPNLKWETTKTFNIGVDFDLFKGGMLSGKIDWYNRNSDDVVGSVAVPYAYGTSTMRLNQAEISNKGIEVELTFKKNWRSTGIGYNTTLTYAYNKNNIESLYNPNIYAYSLVYGTFVEGKPIGAIYSYEYAGLDESGTPMAYTSFPDENGNRTTTTFNDITFHNSGIGLGKLKYSGTTISPSTFGWANQVSWKGLSLYVFLTGKFGGIFRAPTAGSIPIVGSGKTSVNKYIKDIIESDGSDFPCLPIKDNYYMYRWDRYLNYLDCMVENASFIRLKELTLSYSLPQQLMQRLHMQKVKVFAQGRDLGLLWTANKYDYDPEFLPMSGSTKPSASLTLGVNINF